MQRQFVGRLCRLEGTAVGTAAKCWLDLSKRALCSRTAHRTIMISQAVR
ncbi:hypothetical protein H6G76_27895 [Nostoc sp. FACHB-152]|nr:MULTISPECIES: hypothetical protein [unclassified Nostoc]MBD2450882.1 hypothetical protein [Nostoc sp. FACHB-152]MBD2470082.1 hypothetical protein [Nostoc sp. FACHB-145]